MSCLIKFANMSGQKVNNEKTSIFFSENVSQDIKNQIIQRSGFSMTFDLGNNLGVPTLHKRVTSHTYGHIAKKVQDRLVGWKMNYLLMTRRVVLEKSIIKALPTYIMQATYIVAITLYEIDKYQRHFIDEIGKF